MTNIYHHAERELSILSKSSTDPDNRPLIEPFTEGILALAESFGNSGQSGGSAPYTATAISQAIKKLLLFEPLCPITGIDEEWNFVTKCPGDDTLYQNNRDSRVFKDKSGKSWFLDAIIWKEESGGAYFGSAITKNGKLYHSKQFIKSFPFTPKTFYIDVVKEILPEDWNTEPFIEWDYYDTEHFNKTGEKLWKTEKYRNVVKDERQLKKAFRYYDYRPLR